MPHKNTILMSCFYDCSVQQGDEGEGWEEQERLSVDSGIKREKCHRNCFIDDFLALNCCEKKNKQIKH